MNTEVNHSRFSKRARVGLAAAALVIAGGTAGAIAVSATRPTVEMAPLNAVAIRTLSDDGSIITVKGQVAEVYGNKFVMADGSGKALVDTGRTGDKSQLVAVGQRVTVQGRFDHGFVHASYLVGADGKVTGLRPMGPPHGPRDGDGPRGGHGPRGDHGEGSPVPPPPVAGPVTAPANTGQAAPTK